MAAGDRRDWLLRAIAGDPADMQIVYTFDGGRETRDSWSLQRTLVNELAEWWHKPDNGLWEIRGKRRRFTHSRVMNLGRASTTR